MSWLDQPHPCCIQTLTELGLRRRDAERTVLLARTARPQPVPYSPLVGGYAHPESLVVHRKSEDEQHGFDCGTPMATACFEVEASDVKRIDGLRACERCYGGLAR